MSGRAFGYRGGRQDRNPRNARWGGNDVRNVPGRNYRGGSGSWQTQQRQQTMYAASSGANYGRRDPAPYKSPPREIRPSRPQFQRTQPLPHRARSGSGFGPGLSSSYRKPARSITVRRTLKPERSRKRYLKDESYRRESKRPRLSSTSRHWPKKSSGAPKSSRTRLKPSTLILASGVPGEAEEHEFLGVKFLSHPFIQPFVTVNSKTGMITVEVVGMTRYGSPELRDRCEFSILKHDINSIIAFEGDKIPDGITKRKVDPEKDQEESIAIVKGEKLTELDEEKAEINPDIMPSEELRRELKKRGLESRGLKGELIQRLKGAINNDGALIPQPVDPNALFIHVNSEEEEYSADDYGEEPEQEKVNDLPDSAADQEDHGVSNHEEHGVSDQDRHLTEEEKEKVADEVKEQEHENEIREKVLKTEVTEKEFTVEECYAYITGIQGKVRKKDLLTVFKEFGKIVGIAQVSRKCRIQFDTPNAVDKLINRTTPLIFNSHALVITRDPAVTAGTKSKKHEKDVSEAEPMDADEAYDHNDVESEAEQYSDDEVETGRGTTKKDKEKMETDELEFDDDDLESDEERGRSKRRKAIPKKKKRVSPRKRITRKSKAKKKSVVKKQGKRARGRNTKKSPSKKRKSLPEKDSDNDSQDVQENESDNDNQAVLEQKTEVDDDVESKRPVDNPEEHGNEEVESTAVEGEFDFSNEVEADSTVPSPKKHINKDSDHFQSEDDGRQEEEEEDDDMVDEDSGTKDQKEKDTAVSQPSSPMKRDQLAPRDTEAPEDEALEFEEAPEDENREVEEAPQIEQMSGEEENLYKDTVGLKNGMSMLEHLKKQAQASKGKVGSEDKIYKSSNEEKVADKDQVVEEEEEDNQEPEETQEAENFTARSYRVVIAMKRGAKILRRTDTLLRREIVSKTRIVVLEFAITPKNMEPKKVFSSVIDGPLKDYAHGDLWPESGPLSFKRTLTKVLTQMQKARATEKRASTVDALFEENNQLKVKNEELDTKIKNAKKEIDDLKKTIKVARGFLL